MAVEALAERAHLFDQGARHALAFQLFAQVIEAVGRLAGGVAIKGKWGHQKPP